MSWSTQSERIVVVQAQARDPAAFRELVERYQRRLAYYIRRVTGDEHGAFDVMQEVWLAVFRRLASLESPEAFRVWLYKIAHDASVDHLRRSLRQPAPLIDEALVCDELDGWNELEALENAELVHRTLEQLSPPHREVLTLRFLEGMEVSEIAKVIGCAVGTAKSRLHYAKRALRQQIEGAAHG